MKETGYDRQAALAYARRWARARNPEYYNFDAVGGDCTNFISQCIFAGGGVMNYDTPLGWYYISAQNRAPAWSGVEFLYNFVTGNTGAGPYGREVALKELLPGDFAQLSFGGQRFGHSLLVLEVDSPAPGDVLVAAHTYDSYNRPLSSYTYQMARYVHIEGVRSQD